MTFLQLLTENWSIIFFIGGAIFNVGYTWAVKDVLKKKVEDLEARVKTMEETIVTTNKDYSELKGDLKAINTKLDLLLAGKIK